MEPETTTPDKSVKKKSKLPLILIGLGCAFLLCIIVVIAGAVFANKLFDDAHIKGESCKHPGESIHANTDEECCADLKLLKPKSADNTDIVGICSNKCGNGTCDDDSETNYNCPEDCKKEVAQCHKEGELVGVVLDDPGCCEGLDMIPLKEEADGVAGICTAKCGNGICNPTTENETNCPVDCAKTEACIPEGLPIPVIPNAPECCAGLTLIPPKDKDILGISGFCTANCGNGVCETLIESSYNCAVDCGSK